MATVLWICAQLFSQNVANEINSLKKPQVNLSFSDSAKRMNKPKGKDMDVYANGAHA